MRYIQGFYKVTPIFRKRLKIMKIFSNFLKRVAPRNDRTCISRSFYNFESFPKQHQVDLKSTNNQQMTRL